MKIAGIILIIIGVALTIITSTKFFTKEKVVDIGKVEITRDVAHSFNWSPILGIVLIVVGCVVLLIGFKK